MKKLVVGIISSVLLSGCGVAIDDKAFVTAQSQKYYSDHGFRLIGYQGYNIFMAGRCYWYTLEKNGITYQSCLMKWGDELHEYSLQAIDAIKGTAK